MTDLFLILLAFGFIIWFVYAELQKRKRRIKRLDFYQLKPITKENLLKWMQIGNFKILSRCEQSQISECNTGSYQGFDFKMFLFAFPGEEGKFLRQTVTVININKKLPPLFISPGSLSDMPNKAAVYFQSNPDLWVECDAEKLVVYKERQSLTCGVPLELFLKRIIEMHDIL